MNHFYSSYCDVQGMHASELGSPSSLSPVPAGRGARGPQRPLLGWPLSPSPTSLCALRSLLPQAGSRTTSKLLLSQMLLRVHRRRHSSCLSNEELTFFSDTPRMKDFVMAVLKNTKPSLKYLLDSFHTLAMGNHAAVSLRPDSNSFG